MKKVMKKEEETQYTGELVCPTMYPVTCSGTYCYLINPLCYYDNYTLFVFFYSWKDTCAMFHTRHLAKRFMFKMLKTF